MTIDLISITEGQSLACRENELAVLNSHAQKQKRTAVFFQGKEGSKAIKWKRADSVFSFQTRVSFLLAALHFSAVPTSACVYVRVRVCAQMCV